MGLAMKKRLFWVFGLLQSSSLGMIIFLIFRGLNIISEKRVIGLDTQILLSVAFPLFLFLVEYLTFKNR